jgi:methionine synthase I (cobalamin-dependent)
VMPATDASAAETNTATAEVSAVDKLFAGGRMLCDGAMGTMLLDRGIPMDCRYDELNLSQPETVAAVHAECLHLRPERT